MKTYVIRWRQFFNSYPEVSHIQAMTPEEAVEILKRKEGDDIVIRKVKELR